MKEEIQKLKIEKKVEKKENKYRFKGQSIKAQDSKHFHSPVFFVGKPVAIHWKMVIKINKKR